MSQYKKESFVVKASALVFTEAKEGAKNHKITFKVIDAPEGTPPKPEVYADKSIWDEADFPDGQEMELAFDRIPLDNGEKFIFKIASWNGKKQQENANGGGKQGGGKSYSPPSPEQVHSASITGIIKSAYDLAGSTAQSEPSQIKVLIETGINAYWGAMDKARTRGSGSAPSSEETK